MHGSNAATPNKLPAGYSSIAYTAGDIGSFEITGESMMVTLPEPASITLVAWALSALPVRHASGGAEQNRRVLCGEMATARVRIKGRRESSVSIIRENAHEIQPTSVYPLRRVRALAAERMRGPRTGSSHWIIPVRATPSPMASPATQSLAATTMLLSTRTVSHTTSARAVGLRWMIQRPASAAEPLLWAYRAQTSWGTIIHIPASAAAPTDSSTTEPTGPRSAIRPPRPPWEAPKPSACREATSPVGTWIRPTPFTALSTTPAVTRPTTIPMPEPTARSFLASMETMSSGFYYDASSNFHGAACITSYQAVGRRLISPAQPTPISPAFPATRLSARIRTRAL